MNADGNDPAEALGVERDVRLGEADLRVEDERHAPHEGFADLEQEDEAQHRGGNRDPVLHEEAHQGGHGRAAEPGGGTAERTGHAQAGGDSLLVLGLGGDSLRRDGLADEQEADVAEDDHDAQHEKRRLPVVLDACVLEPVGRFQSDDAAELEAAPPAYDRNGSTGGHRLALRLPNLLDSERVDGDVLSRGGNGDGEADGNDGTEAFGRVRRAPQDETHQHCGLKDQDPGAPLAESLRKPRQPDTIDERGPEKVERVDAEYEAGPADRAAAEAVLRQPEGEAAPDEHPGEAADDPEKEDAGHPPLEIDGERFRESLHDVPRATRCAIEADHTGTFRARPMTCPHLRASAWKWAPALWRGRRPRGMSAPTESEREHGGTP